MAMHATVLNVLIAVRPNTIAGNGEAQVRVLLVPDKPSWSVDRIARALVVHNRDSSLSLDVLPLKGNVGRFLSEEKTYDRVLMMTFQQLDLLPWYHSIL